MPRKKLQSTNLNQPRVKCMSSPLHKETCKENNSYFIICKMILVNIFLRGRTFIFTSFSNFAIKYMKKAILLINVLSVFKFVLNDIFLQMAFILAVHSFCSFVFLPLRFQQSFKRIGKSEVLMPFYRVKVIRTQHPPPFYSHMSCFQKMHTIKILRQYFY